MHRSFSAFALIASSILAIGATPPDAASFVLDPRLDISLWTAEPDVVDPVALAFDAAGFAFVAECRDYPYGAGSNGSVGSSIRRLRLAHPDLSPSRPTLFATNLSYVTAVTPWRDGILVAAPPEILFLKDTDDDGVADVREIILSGFHRGVSDSLVNGLRFGPDGHIHGANGGNGGRLRSTGLASPLELAENDFAFNPDSRRAWITGRTGGGFGLVFDDIGRAFTTYNIDHIQHRYLAHDELDLTIASAFTSPTTSISDHGEMARIFPVSTPVTRPNHPEQSGHFSAAGGMGFLGRHTPGWPEDLTASVFVCDVVGNLVHRDRVATSGAALVASRPANETDREFLASRDPAFRPVGLELGPDNALYLLDMQREVIEHPDYIPEATRRGLDLRSGADRGRIWRIRPRTAPASRSPWEALSATASLVQLLDHPNSWWRTTAHRLLIERRPAEAPPLLRARALTNTPPGQANWGRFHALRTLSSLGLLDRETLAPSLSHPEPDLREVALSLVRLDSPEHMPLAGTVLDRLSDPAPRVRFKAAIALRLVPTEATARALASLLRRDWKDPWIRRVALQSTPPRHRGALLQVLRELPHPGDLPSFQEALRQTAQAVAADPSLDEQALAQLLPGWIPSAAEPVRLAVIEGLYRGLELRQERPQWQGPLPDLLTRQAASWSDADYAAVLRLVRIGKPFEVDHARRTRARASAIDNELPATQRAAAIGLLAGEDPDTVLVPLLDLRQPAEVQEAAFEVLQRDSRSSLGTALIRNWRQYSPAMRPRILKLLLDRRSFHEAIVLALESGDVRLGELNLDLEQRRRLLRGASKSLLPRIARFVSDQEYANRKKIVEDLLALLPAHGDPAAGRNVFTESCAACHRCNGLGTRVGPDLSGVAHRSTEDLLGNILDPNMAINPAFVSYEIETTDGETLVGIPESNTDQAVTLVQAAGQRRILARREIRKMTSTGASLMPEGLEAGRSPQQLRDLIAFIQGVP